MTLPARLAAPGLAPLWRAVHQRLCTGLTVSRVRVGPLGEDQRSAVADLLGLDRLPGEYLVVRLDRLDAALAEAVGRDTRAVVAELVGPLEDRAARRATDLAERAELWQWLAGHEVVAAQPSLDGWVEQVRRGGVVAGSVSRTRKLMQDVFAVLRSLPGQGTPLPSFADDVLHDPHALDDGTRLASLVLRALAAIYATEPPASAEQRRALWERAGIAEDELSTVVLAAGLMPTSASLASSILRDCARAGQAAALTLAQLRHSPDLGPAATDVWVVENPSVLALALHRFGASCPPLVCTSGWPNSAGIVLLRRLAEAGVALHYHGDFDGEGIRIAAHLFAKTPAQPWRMSTSDYLAAVRDHPAGPPVGRVTEAPWDPELAEALRRHGTAVVQERVAADLLDELPVR